MKRLVILLALLASPVAAEEQCLEYGKMEANMRAKGFARLGWGEAKTNWFELWVDVENAFWIATAVSSDGRKSCIKGAGIDWHFDAPPKKGEPL